MTGLDMARELAKALIQRGKDVSLAVLSGLINRAPLYGGFYFLFWRFDMLETKQTTDAGEFFAERGEVTERKLEKPFTVYDPRGRLMRITGEYDLGGGSCFFTAEEVPPYEGEKT
jgi:hypothetical protein